MPEWQTRCGKREYRSDDRGPPLEACLRRRRAGRWPQIDRVGTPQHSPPLGKSAGARQVRDNVEIRFPTPGLAVVRSQPLWRLWGATPVDVGCGYTFRRRGRVAALI